MKRCGLKPRVLRVVTVTPAKSGMAEPVQYPSAVRGRASSSVRTNEWLSEEEMPDRNIDGTPMVNGVDLNGRPYGRCAAREDNPWHVDAAHACGPSPLDASSDPCAEAGAPASNAFCTVGLVVVEGRTRHARHSTRGAMDAMSHAVPPLDVIQACKTLAPTGGRHASSNHLLVVHPFRRGLGSRRKRQRPTGGSPMSIVCHGMRDGVPVPRRSTAALACRALRGRGMGRAFADGRRTGQLLLQCLAERNEVGSERKTDVAQLDHIDAAYAALDVAHEVLHHAEFRRQVFLAYAAPAARRLKQFAQPLVFDSMDGLAHGRFRWERSWTLYCRIVYTKIVYLAHMMLGVFAKPCAWE